MIITVTLNAAIDKTLAVPNFRLGQRHRAVEQTFVPAIGRRLEARRATMGLDALRPWDTGVDPEGRSPLRPYKEIEELNAKTQEIFAKVDPLLGSLRLYGLVALDLKHIAGELPVFLVVLDDKY